MKKWTGWVFGGMLLASAVLYGKGSGVTLTSRSYKEIIVIQNGKKVKKLVDTKKVLPGDMIVYVNTVNNNRNKPVKNMVINNPIPKETAYVAGSAKCERPCTILFSADGGKHFAAAGEVKIQTKKGTRIARADEYTNVRWILKDPLPSGQHVYVSYKAKLR